MRSKVLEAVNLKFVVLLALAVAALLLPPELLADNWLQTAAQGVVMAVAVVGFNLLFSAGQLSLGHAFFMGLGGFTYAYCASNGTPTLGGLGLPPLIALVIAVLVAGLAGLAFSPISSRLGGLSLAAASLGLVFLGNHVFLNAAFQTGGAAGRPVEEFAIGGLKVSTLTDLWYFTVVVALAAFWFAHHIAQSRIGLGLNAIRDGELFASAMGVRVQRYKAQAFLVSSMYAGLAGAMLALVVGVLVPDTFDLLLSLNILMMSILGGAAYVVGGGVVGALVFVALPELLSQYAQVLPFVQTDQLAGGLTPGDAANYIYGGAIILIIILWPNGLVGLFMRLASLVQRRLKPPLPTGAADETTVTTRSHRVKPSAR